jgi:hypothetical protein
VALAALLLAGGALLAYETRGTTFWTDEWSWIIHRRGGGLATYLNAHDEHLSLVPVAIYKLLFATVGLRHYWPYRAVLIVAQLACVSLVFVYARPRVGDYFALLGAALIMFFGPGWQDILWPFQMAWLIAIGAGIGALLLLDRQDRVGDAGACALIVVSMASAGPGLAVAVGLIVEILQRRRWRDVWIVAIPLALYGLWWLGYQQTMVNREAFLRLPSFVFRAAAGALSSIAGLSGINVYSGHGNFLTWGIPLLVVGIALAVWRLRRLRRIPPRVVTLAAMILAFWVITGIGRAYLRVGSLVLTGTGYESRYLYVSAVLIILLAVELARGAAMSLAGRVVIGVLALGAVVSNLGPLQDAGRLLRADAELTRVQLGTLDLTRGVVKPNFASGAVVFGIVEAQPYFEAERQLGSPAANAAQIAAAPDSARAAADGQLIEIHQPALRPVPPGDSPATANAPRLDGVSAGAVSVRAGCLDYKPPSYTATGAAHAMAVTLPPLGVLLSAGPRPVTVGLRRFSSEFQPVASLAAKSRATLSIGRDLAAEPWHLQVASSGPFAVCGLQPGAG